MEIRRTLLELHKKIVQNTLSKKERLEVTKKISALLIDELQSQGFTAKAFKDSIPGYPNSESWMVHLQTMSERNKAAKVLAAAHEKLDAEFIFSPYLQAKSPHIGGVHIGRSDTIILPIQSILHGNVGTETAVLHEIRHLKLTKMLREGKPSPYYGEIVSLTNKPVATITGYEDGFSFEEMATYQREMQHNKRGIISSSDLFIASQKNEDTTLDSAELLKEISENVLRTTALSRVAIEKNQGLSFYLDINTGKVAAEIFILENGEKAAKITYWLVDSQSLNMETNKKLLLQYLDNVDTAAHSHIKAAEKMIETYKKK